LEHAADTSATELSTWKPEDKAYVQPQFGDKKTPKTLEYNLNSMT